MDTSFVRRGDLRLRVAATRPLGRCCGARGRAQHWLHTINPHLILMRTVHLAGIAFIRERGPSATNGDDADDIQHALLSRFLHPLAPLLCSKRPCLSSDEDSTDHRGRV